MPIHSKKQLMRSILPIIYLLLSPFTLQGRTQWKDDFDSGNLDTNKWSACLNDPENRLCIEPFSGRGYVLHILARKTNAEVTTNFSLGGDDKYRLEFSFYQPSSENEGYAGVVHHPGCSLGYSFWWLEWQPPELHLWTIYHGIWAQRWKMEGIETDKWYRVVITNEPNKVSLSIYSDGKIIGSSGAIPHDSGFSGPLSFGAHTGGGLRGILLDDIGIDYAGPTSTVKLPESYKRTAPQITLRNSFLQAGIATDTGWLLSLRKGNGNDVFEQGIGRILIDDVSEGKRYSDADFHLLKDSLLSSEGKASFKQVSRDGSIILETTLALERNSLIWNIQLSSLNDQPHSGRVSFHLPFPSWCEEVFLPSLGAPFDRETLRSVYAYRDPTNGFCIPLATLYSPKKGIGLSVFVDPESQKPALLFGFTPKGNPPSFQVQWDYLRLEKGRDTKLCLHIALHPGDWRCGLSWLIQDFPHLFQPQIDVAPGHQVIAGQLSDERVKWLRNLGFTWEETHLLPVPFYGRYISEENTPEEIEQANSYLKMIHQNDFQLYIYWSFNETEPRFAEENFPDSISKYPDGGAQALGWGNFFLMVPFPQGKWHDYILGQLEQMLSAFPDVDGVFVDNTLQSIISYGQDDGITFINGKPAYQYAFAQHNILREAKEMLLKRSKGLWANQSCDIESAQYMDGILVENRRDWLESQQYFGLLKPMVFITYYDREDPKREEKLLENLRAAFRCGVMLAFNEWELQPEVIDLELLCKWLPLFEPLRGRSWVLEPECISFPKGIRGNIFRTKEGDYYIALVPEEGMKGKRFQLEIKVPNGNELRSARLYTPDTGKWQIIGLMRSGERIILNVRGLKEAGGLLLKH